MTPPVTVADALASAVLPELVPAEVSPPAETEVPELVLPEDPEEVLPESELMPPEDPEVVEVEPESLVEPLPELPEVLSEPVPC